MRKLKLRPGALPAGVSPLHPAVIAATACGVGFAPLATGTWGSLVTLPLGWMIATWFGASGLIVSAFAATFIGVVASNWLLARGAHDDPGFIVIDEVAGQLLALAFVPTTWWAYALAFVFFRFADVTKPFPANWCDQKLDGGWGVMADDLVAGLYAGIASWVAIAFLPIARWIHALGI
jgi:phosphatidylglycerophosphatase A